MTNPAASSFPALDVSWNEIARACRRVCLLREQRRDLEAESLLQGSIAAMVARLRTTAGSDEDVTARLDAILAAETERVSNAAVLAELLAPLLLASRSPQAESIAPVPSPASVILTASPAPPPIRPHPPAADIADFIDEMLALERPREPAGHPRRA